MTRAKASEIVGAIADLGIDCSLVLAARRGADLPENATIHIPARFSVTEKMPALIDLLLERGVDVRFGDRELIISDSVAVLP